MQDQPLLPPSLDPGDGNSLSSRSQLTVSRVALWLSVAGPAMLLLLIAVQPG